MNQVRPASKSITGWYYGFFVQDDFQIHPRLTLNLGLATTCNADHGCPRSAPDVRSKRHIHGLSDRAQGLLSQASGHRRASFRRQNI